MWLHNQPPPAHLFFPTARNKWSLIAGVFLASKNEGGVTLSPTWINVELGITNRALTSIEVKSSRLIGMIDFVGEEGAKELLEKADDVRSYHFDGDQDAYGETGSPEFKEAIFDEDRLLYKQNEIEAAAVFRTPIPIGEACIPYIAKSLENFSPQRHYLLTKWIIKNRDGDMIIPLYDPNFRRPGDCGAR